MGPNLVGGDPKFYDADIRFIPESIPYNSFFAGAINTKESTYKTFQKKGLNSNAGKLLMHEFGHYLQNKYDTFLLVDDKPVNWEEYIDGCQNGKMRLFIISKDSVDKYGWKDVLTKNIYTKVYRLDISDIEKSKWQIEYIGY